MNITETCFDESVLPRPTFGGPVILRRDSCIFLPDVNLRLVATNIDTGTVIRP